MWRSCGAALFFLAMTAIVFLGSRRVSRPIAVAAPAKTLWAGSKEYTGHETDVVSQFAQDADKYAWLTNPEVEHKLWDRSRVDMLTDRYAIEADWSYKWDEAIGQSLYYSQVTGRQPGILLLVKNSEPMDSIRRDVFRCQLVASQHGIDIWLVKVGD